MSVIRQVKEGIQYQGEDEQIVYTITTTPWGSDPSSSSVVVKDVENSYLDVTSTVCTGSSSESGDVVTLPTIASLTRDRTYRVEVKFTSGSNLFEVYFFIEGER